MTQFHATKFLAAYLDRELDVTTHRQVEEHLTTCKKCQGEFEQLKLGARFAERTPLFVPSDSIWADIQLQVGTRSNTKSTGLFKLKPSHRNKLIYFSAAAIVILLTFFYFKSPTSTPVSMDLHAYLSSLEAQPASAFPRAFGMVPAKFERVDVQIGSQAAGFEGDQSKSPLPEFELVSCRIRKVADQGLVQFLYGKSDEAFAVFVAPESTTLNFGERVLTGGKVEEIAGVKIAASNVSAFCTEIGGLFYIVVSQFLDDEETALVIRHFVSAQKLP